MSLFKAKPGPHFLKHQHTQGKIHCVMALVISKLGYKVVDTTGCVLEVSHEAITFQL